MATTTIDTETVRRQVRVAKIVMSARAHGLTADDIAHDRDGARENALTDIWEADPTFHAPSDETWRLVVAHLSVVSL